MQHCSYLGWPLVLTTFKIIREGRLCSPQRLVLTKIFDIPAPLVLAYLLTYARKVVATDFQQLQYIRT